MRGEGSKSIKTNLKWSFLGNYGRQGIGFIISLVLARLLTPEDFGLFGLSLALINILKIFMSMGLTEALVQNKNAAGEAFNSVFVVNLLFGLIGSALLVIFASNIAIFYAKPEVESIVKLLAIIFLLESLNVTQTAYLKKTMAFKNLTTRVLAAQFIGGGIALIAAFSDFGIYALIIQHVTINIFKTFLLWRVSDWKPKMYFDFEQLKMLRKYAMYSFSAQAVGKVITETSTLAIAKFFNPITLGYFSRGNSFSNLIVSNSSNSLRVVLFSSLSEVQDDPKKFRSIFNKTFELVLIASIVFSGLAFLNAELLIIGLFGEKWEPTIIIFKWLLIRGLTRPLSGIIVTAILSKGLAKENFFYGNVKRALSLLVLISLIFEQLELYLMVLFVSEILSFAFNLFLSKKFLDLNFKTHFIPYILNFIFSIFIILLLVNTVNLSNVYLESIVQSMIFICVLIIFQYYFNRKAFDNIKQLISKRLKFISKFS